MRSRRTFSTSAVALALAGALLGTSACKKLDAEKQKGSASSSAAVPWESERLAANAAIKKADYKTAEAALKRALEIAKKHDERSPAYADLLFNLGQVYAEQHRTEAALHHFQRSRDLEEKRLGPNAPRVADANEAMAGVMDVQKRYADAEVLFRLVLKSRLEAKPPDPVAIGSTYSNLAINLTFQGKTQAALEAYDAAIDNLSKSQSSKKELSYAEAGVGTLLMSAGKLSDAQVHVLRALTLAEDTLGADHPHVATILFNLSAIQYDLGRQRQAIATIAKCVEIRRKTLRADHPYVASAEARLREFSTPIAAGSGKMVTEKPAH